MRLLSSFVFVLCILVVAVCPIQLLAQESDSTAKVVSDTLTEEERAAAETSLVQQHSPAKATIMSAILPGLGQAYNKKYWKIPIIYAGFATSYYFIDQNRTQYRRFRKAYLYEVDGDSTTISEFAGTNIPAQALRNEAESFQTLMEISYIAAGAIYVLNIVDAAVDAHLFYFNVSDDLAMRVQPVVLQSFRSSNLISGFKLSLHFNSGQKR